MTAREQGSFLIRIDSDLIDEPLMAAIVRSASDAMIAEDLAGNVIFWNDAASELLGHGAADMRGQPLRNLAPSDHLHEEGTIAARVRAGERVAPYDTLRLTASNSMAEVTIVTSPLRDASHAIIGASHVLRPVRTPTMPVEAEASAQQTSHSILVVEDEFIIGMSLASTLENAGFEVLGPAGSVDEALEILARNRCALAILDVNLGEEETSAPLAEWLKDHGIPFFVTSGYAADQRPNALRGVPSFSKPVGARAILAAVQAVLR